MVWVFNFHNLLPSREGAGPLLEALRFTPPANGGRSCLKCENSRSFRNQCAKTGQARSAGNRVVLNEIEAGFLSFLSAAEHIGAATGHTGDLIFHDSWQMHAMRTRRQPLLAFAGWIEVGDRRAIGWSRNTEDEQS